MTFLVGQGGYTSIKEKTNLGCKVFVNFTPLQPSCLKDRTLQIHYCLIPQEEKAPLPPIDSYRALWEAVQDGRELVVFEDKVLDLKRFSGRHPGGYRPIRTSYGHEIGRYIYGGYQQRRHLHKHTSDAIGLMEKYQIDTIPDPLRDTLYLGKTPGRPIEEYIFTAQEINGLTDIHSDLTFKNPEIQFVPSFKNIRDYGKYFAVYCPNKGIIRNYGCIFSLLPDIFKNHSEMIRAVDNKAEFSSPYPHIENLVYDSIHLAVEEKGPFSSFLTRTEESHKITLKGPFGSGIDLDDNHKGAVVVIIDETGMLMLLDLLMYMVRLNAFKIGQKTGKTYKIFGDEELDSLTDPSFKLIVYGYFREKARIPFYPVLKTLSSWEQQHSLGNFTYYEHFFEEGEEPLRKEEFEETLPHNVSRVIMFGNHALLLHSKLLLMRFGIPEDYFLEL